MSQREGEKRNYHPTIIGNGFHCVLNHYHLSLSLSLSLTSNNPLLVASLGCTASAVSGVCDCLLADERSRNSKALTPSIAITSSDKRGTIFNCSLPHSLPSSLLSPFLSLPLSLSCFFPSMQYSQCYSPLPVSDTRRSISCKCPRTKAR